jgi:hypothetical protein
MHKSTRLGDPAPARSAVTRAPSHSRTGAQATCPEQPVVSEVEPSRRIGFGLQIAEKARQPDDAFVFIAECRHKALLLLLLYNNG